MANRTKTSAACINFSVIQVTRFILVRRHRLLGYTLSHYVFDSSTATVLVFDVDGVYSFVTQRQFQLAKHVITMPLASFHKTAQDVGSPRVPLCWLASTSRAGSALVANVLGAAPTTRVLQDPDVLTCLGALLRDGQLPVVEYNQLLVSAVGLLCKPDDR